jgi:hypothetical protein
VVLVEQADADHQLPQGEHRDHGDGGGDHA